MPRRRADAVARQRNTALATAAAVRTAAVPTVAAAVKKKPSKRRRPASDKPGTSSDYQPGRV